MEGGAYLCTWKKEGRGFRILVKGHPDLQAAASTFDEARAKLWELILDQRGDGESAFDFDRPVPAGVLPAKYARPEIVMVSGNDSALVTDAAGLFEGGICALCNNPVGPRNDRPAQVSDISGATDGAISFHHVGSIFSEDFAQRLLGMKGGAVQFRRVDVTKRVKKKFFELIGPALATEVAVRNHGRVDGIECPQCQRKTFCQRVGVNIQSFIARSDVPKRVPPCFTVRRRETIGLCMTGKAWRGIQGTPGTRNILGEPVGVVPDDDVVRDPPLPMLPRKKGSKGSLQKPRP